MCEKGQSLGDRSPLLSPIGIQGQSSGGGLRGELKLIVIVNECLNFDVFEKQNL